MQKLADERIAKIFKSLCEIPSLPAAVEKLVQLSEKDSTPRDFAELIERDQGLTAKVLRLVNSAFYSLRTPIASLRHASTLLGTRTLKSLTLSVSVMNLFHRACAGFEPLAFWRHSISVALASKKLGALVLPALEEDLYVAGLLHDIGVALLVQHLSTDYALVLKLAKAQKRNLAEIEEEVFGVSHAEVGCTLASRWRLPPLVCDCIRYHESSQGTPGVPAEHAKVIDIVRFADEWADWCGLDFFVERPQGLPKPALPTWITSDLAEIERAIEGLKADVAEKELCFFPKGEAAPKAAGTPA
jgi:HD-like signal output (HDOD) protein